MLKFPLIIASLVLVSCSGSSVTSQRSSFSSPKLPPPGGSPNIFKKYSPTENSVMMDGWARDFDMSGVSFDQRMTVTLITRRHVVMARHYPRKPGLKVIFHGRNGERIERIMKTVRPVYGDISVGLLNLDVPPGFKVYPLPTPTEDYSHLVGKTAVVTDQNRRLFFHQVASTSHRRMSFRHHKPNLHGWGKKLIKGDSGNPSFMISGNELVIVETHTNGGGGAGPFYGNPEIQKLLQEKITELSPGYKFRTKNL